MKWPPIIPDLAVVIAVWAAVLWTVRQRRTRLGAAPSSGALRNYRLHAAAAICAMVGVTWFGAWLVTDAIGPRWLHILSLPATLICVAAAAVVAGYAGWRGGP